jgi:hypothetical protein
MPGVESITSEPGKRRGGCQAVSSAIPLAKQVQLLAQQHELTEHRAGSVAVIAAEVGNGLEVGLEVPQQPDHLDIGVRLGFEPAAGSDAVEVTIHI